MKSTVMNVMVLLLVVGLIYGTAIGQPPPIPAQEQPEILTRGPVHEAFSEPVILQIQAGLVVSNQPPADIDEVPPAERPRGNDYVWVPGYWSWDGDRNNYIWVSGCWREAPPNMSWVPGYWSQESDGWEWVAGFWTTADIQDIEYLPAPPDYVDEQPGPPPSVNDIWVPSCQYWHRDRYIDRPGYWLMANPNWVWIPSHYIWTPRGYIFSEGHWDYPLENRGVLFAPVYFPPYYYGRSGYSYSPSIVLDLGVLSINLFSYPRYNHYYFGDYYDDSYLRMGIYPRYEVVTIHTWYDPTFAYDRWHHRDDPRWEDNQRHDYDRRRADKDLRPPRTYNDMETRLANKPPEQQQNDIRIARPLTVVAASKETPIKFEHIDTQAQQKIATQATAVQKYKAERNQWESTPADKKTVRPGMERKDAVISPVDQKEQVTKQRETKTQQMTPPEQKGPMTSPDMKKEKMSQPKENKNQQMTPGERKGSMTAPDMKKEKMAQPKETKDQIVPPREVIMTKPERVKVPTPPIVGKPAAMQKSMPPQPVNERKYKGEVQDTTRNIQPAGKTKDTGNDMAKDKVKAKAKGKGKVK